MSMPIASATPAAAPDPYAFNMNDDLKGALDVCEYQPSDPGRPWKDSDGKGGGGMSFGDFLDVINPLQHLPVISTIYRAISGDKPGLVSELLGGALYGGPIGALAAGVSAAFEGATGKTDGEMLASVASAVFGGDDSGAATAGSTAVAAATSATQATAPVQTAQLPPAARAAAPQIAVAPEAAGASLEAAATAVPPTGPASLADHPSRARPTSFPAHSRARAFPAFDPRRFPVRAAAPETSAAVDPGAAGPAGAAASGGDPESQRIAASVAAQQRAQLGLILANMNAAPAAGPAPAGGPAPIGAVPSAAGISPVSDAPGGPDAAGAPLPGAPSPPRAGGRPQPATNPFLLGTSGGPVSPAAMRAALDRYQRAIEGYAPPAANP